MAEENAPAPLKKRKVGPKLKNALLQVIERKKVGFEVDYKAICARTGVPVLSLRSAYSDYCKGKMDLGAPETFEELEIDVKAQHHQQITLGRRHKAIVLRAYEQLIYKVEDLMSKGADNVFAFKELTDVLRELKNVCQFLDMTEKGYNAALEEIEARINRMEKQVQGKDVTITPEDVQVGNASEAQKALEALNDWPDAVLVHTPSTSEVSTQNGT